MQILSTFVKRRAGREPALTRSLPTVSFLWYKVACCFFARYQSYQAFLASNLRVPGGSEWTPGAGVSSTHGGLHGSVVAVTRYRRRLLASVGRFRVKKWISHCIYRTGFRSGFSPLLITVRRTLRAVKNMLVVLPVSRTLNRRAAEGERLRDTNLRAAGWFIL